MKKVFAALCLFIVSVGGQVAAAENVDRFSVEIARDHIDVTVGFTGSSIELFGDRRDANTDVAIVVEGPKKDITVWKKKKVMGTWVNLHYTEFEDIPVYYQYSISNPDIDEDLQTAMHEKGVGVDAMLNKADIDKSGGILDITPFKKALYEQKKEQGFYFENAADFRFLNENFFRVHFDIPPSAQTGEYKIYSYLIKNGQVTETGVDTMTVEQVGLNAFIYQMAHDHSFLYALVCITLALSAGWLVSVLKVRP